MTTTWHDIAGYEGRYQISDDGRVKSLPFKQRYLLRNGKEHYRTTREQILAQQLINSGYLLVHLHLDNQRRAFTVHTLVAKAFVPGSGETVNHKDGNKQNNRASNLEWASYTENHLHAVALGLNRAAVRVVHPQTGEVFASINRAVLGARVARRIVSQTWARA